MNKKKIASLFLSAFILSQCAISSVQAQENVHKNTINIVDSSISKDKFSSLINKELSQYKNTSVNFQNELLTKSLLNISDPLAINVNDLFSSTNIIKNIKTLTENNIPIYIYGTDLNMNRLEEALGIELDGRNELISNEDKALKGEKINNFIEENKWDIIGIRNNKIYLSNIQNFDDNNNIIEPDFYSCINNILNYNLKVQSDNISPYAIDPSGNSHMASAYDVEDSLYISGVLRGNLNADYELYKNNSHDSDPEYDYFFLKNNVELIEDKPGAEAMGIRIKHLREYTSDQLREWGPYADSNSKSFTVGLPWNVSWSFDVGSNLNVDVTGGQTDDYVEWYFHNGQIFGDYPFPNPITRVTPGSAWASTGTYVSLGMENKGYIKFSGSTYLLNTSKAFQIDY